MVGSHYDSSPDKRRHGGEDFALHPFQQRQAARLSKKAAVAPAPELEVEDVADRFNKVNISVQKRIPSACRGESNQLGRTHGIG